MRRILVLNTKGGCGKTTLATNLASLYAGRGLRTVLMDHDPQASSMHWLAQRPANRPPIHGIAVHARSGSVTGAWHQRLPHGTERVIVDAPAGLAGIALVDRVQQADAVLVPVLPSAIDIRASADFIRDLLLLCKVRTRGIRVGLVANRVRKNTVVYQALRRFLDTLDLPFLATLRDTQHYVRAADQGLGVHELTEARTVLDQNQWRPILAWLEQAPARAPAVQNAAEV